MMTLLRILEALGQPGQASALHALAPWPYLSATRSGTPLTLALDRGEVS